MTPTAVVITILAYVAILLAVARYSGRGVDNSGFFAGNRQTSWYMAWLAMIGAAMSGITFLSVPGSVGTDAFSYMQMVAGFTVGQLVVAYVLIPVFYRKQVISLYEYLEDRFGITTHRTGAWFFFVSKVLNAALRIYVICIVLQQMIFEPCHLPFGLNALVVVCVVWLYTRQGGVRVLIRTDILKTVVMLLSLGTFLFFITRDLDLSLSETIHEVVVSPMSQLFFFDDPSSERYFWKMFLAGIVLLIAMTGLDQDLMQRNLSCRTLRDAQRNIVFTAVSQIVVILLFLVLGVLLHLYLQHHGLAIPERSDQIFSTVAFNSGLPTVVGIMFVVGLVSITYSAAGSALTALTTSFTIDILSAHKFANESRLTTIRQRVHLAIAILLFVVIVVFERYSNDSTINLVYKMAGYTYGPILGMFCFGLMTSYAIRERLIPAIAFLSVVLSVGLQYVAELMWNYHIGFELLIYNAGFTFIGMLLLVKHHEK